MKLSKPLTNNDLANEYSECTGNSPYIRSIDTIFNWAERQANKFYVCPEHGTIHKILTN